MTDRRHAADRITGRGANEVAVGTRQGFTHMLRHFCLADAIVTACDDNHRLATARAAKYDRLRNLGNGAADCSGGVGTCTRRLFELDDLGVDASVAK